MNGDYSWPQQVQWFERWGTMVAVIGMGRTCYYYAQVSYMTQMGK
jgi:hypothetical protein